MKMYFLDPTSRVSINIRRLRRLSFPVQRLILSTVAELSTLVVLGDGSPEDEIVGILACHQGNKTVGITKPEKHSTDAFREIRQYLKIRSINKLLFILDQDTSSLESIFSTVESIFREQGITFQLNRTFGDTEKVRLYECSIGNRHFAVITVVSGLAEFTCNQHMIEDHLIMLAGFQSGASGKAQWQSLSSEEKLGVLTLLKDKDVVEVAFPQHYFAFELVESDC
ncbi:MAG: hypothetical protein NWF05_06515 [Candidatus Bathyarchaeota archaeon]|nr:hypothetical protein [Candidatus Bathyarchaeota archaeon]